MVAVIPVGLPSDIADVIARRLATSGAVVVLVTAGASGAGADRAGALAAAIDAGGSGRAAVYTLASAADVDGLADFVAELFPA